jgi:hypothetical protein
MTGYGAPQPQQRSGQQLPLFDLIGAGLGILAFIWGFLDWYKVGGGGLGNSSGVKGYNLTSPGAAAIGLSLLAGFVAAAVLLDKDAKGSLVPLAASASSLLVTFGLLVGKGDGVDTQIGLILMLITALAQVGLFTTSWLQAQGKIMTGGSATAGAAGQWGGGTPYGGYPAQQQQPQYGQQPPAQPQYGQQPPAQPQYGQPTQHQQPAQPQYGQPTQHQQPAQPQTPQQQPGYGQQPPANPYGQG